MRKLVLGGGLIGAVGLLGSALLVVGCKSNEESETSKPTAEEQAATISTGPVVDNKIAKAVANAAKAQPGAAAAGEEGPPENGILGVGRADAELAKGAAPKLKLGATGSEPKVQLGSALVGGSTAFDKKSGQLDVSLRTGASMLPGTSLKLEFSQPSAPAPASQTTDGALTPTPSQVVVSIAQSDLSSNQPAQIPAELAAEIRKLKGTQLTYQLQETQLVGAATVVLAKGANQQLDTLVQAAGSGLNDAVLAYPKEPVGVGAFWMVTSRERLLGTDVVSYRMVKVVDVTDGKARLEVNTKRYLADGGIGLPGIEDAKVHQFHAESSAQLSVAAGQSLPLEGRSQTGIRSFAEIEGQPRPIQIELRTEFVFK